MADHALLPAHPRQSHQPALYRPDRARRPGAGPQPPAHRHGQARGRCHRSGPAASTWLRPVRRTTGQAGRAHQSDRTRSARRPAQHPRTPALPGRGLPVRQRQPGGRTFNADIQSAGAPHVGITAGHAHRDLDRSHGGHRPAGRGLHPADPVLPAAGWSQYPEATGPDLPSPQWHGPVDTHRHDLLSGEREPGLACHGDPWRRCRDLLAEPGLLRGLRSAGHAGQNQRHHRLETAGVRST